MNIKLHTYPEGAASRMSQDEIVSRMTDLGRFTDCYVGELAEGDRYLININDSLPEISLTYAFTWMEARKLTNTYKDDRWAFYLRNEDGRLELFHEGQPGITLMGCLCHMIEMEEL